MQFVDQSQVSIVKTSDHWQWEQSHTSGIITDTEVSQWLSMINDDTWATELCSGHENNTVWVKLGAILPEDCRVVLITTDGRELLIFNEYE